MQPDALQCFAYDSFFPPGLTAPMYCRQPTVGRYVTLVRTGDRIRLAFCELEVYGYELNGTVWYTETETGGQTGAPTCHRHTHTHARASARAHTHTHTHPLSLPLPSISVSLTHTHTTRIHTHARTQIQIDVQTDTHRISTRKQT